MSRHVPAVICIGRNYAAHASELGHEVLDRPIVFFKNPASVCGANDDIRIPEICRHEGPQVDYEGELAVVIGRDCRDLSQEDALSVVSGYAVANDVSARWWQKSGSGGQYSRGKSFDTFCPLSEPVPASSVPDPQDLTLRTSLNGEVVQESSTADMIFPVGEVIAELSRGMTIIAGSILLTGTPAGVGASMDPKRFLAHGDVVEVEIDRVGRLCNRVVED